MDKKMVLMAVLLVAMLIFTGIQAIQLSQISGKITSAGVAYGTSDSSGGSAPVSQPRPSSGMVGGC